MGKLGKPERRPETVEEWAEEIYSVLALMPWSSHRNAPQLEALCEALWSARGGPLTEERILSCLLRPRCAALVSVYCSTALRLQRDHLLRNAPETQGRVKDMQVFFKVSSEALIGNHRWGITLLDGKNKKLPEGH